jgi:predicted phosphodiesterase
LEDEKMKRKLWTKEEERLVEKLKAEGKSVQEIADILSKSYDSVAHKYRHAETEPPTQPKKEKINLSALIIQTLKNELANVEPYKASIQSKVDTKGDTLVIQLTDFHAGKIVKNQEGEIIYNEEIFRNRINRLCEQALKLLDNNISKGVPIRDVVLLLNGDLCNGENIYLTQAFEQEAAPPAQVMLVIDVLTKLIISLLKRNLPVRVIGIRGNHGRTAKDTDVASNWDLMTYEILDFWSKLVLKNPKLQIKFAETEHIVFDIRGHKFMMRHIAPEQCDSPAGRVKINEWARQFEVESIIFGHYHHAGIFDCDNVRVIRGGSTVGGDSLSDSMAKYSQPIQVIFGVNEQRVTTFIYFVDLGLGKK